MSSAAILIVLAHPTIAPEPSVAYSDVLVRVQAALALLSTATSREVLPRKGYEEVLASTRVAIDAGTALRLRAELREDEDRATSSFGIAVIDFYLLRLAARIPSAERLAEPNPEAVRTRIKRCMKHDPSASYPVALYSWFVSNYRDPDLPKPKREFVGNSTAVGPDGKKIITPMYRVLEDPAKDALVQELNLRALELDRDNPMAKYGLAASIKDPVESAKQLWTTIGEPGQYIWETDALARIKLRAKDDPETQARVAKRIEQLKAKIGADSPRLKAYGF
jgi:hypothetical protein